MYCHVRTFRSPRAYLLVVLLFQFSPGATTAKADFVQRVAVHYSAEALDVPFPVRQAGKPSPWAGADKGPVAGLAVFATESAGAVWMGGTNGAARFDAKANHSWDRWQYFGALRWLRDDDVQNIHVVESNGLAQVWIRTRTAVSLISSRRMTLADKAAHYEELTEKRHVRLGMVSGSGLRDGNDLSSNYTTDNDNDGLWTAMYLGAEAYRYAATKSEEARARARRALGVLIRLEEITGIPGFPARSFKSKDEPAPHGGEWHWTPDQQWRWKGDTSSDESVGHYYGYALAYDLIADEGEKKAIAKVVARLTDHLIEHDYELIDLDGKPTRWGQWSESFYKTEEGRYEAPLRSIELLAFLKVAHHVTGAAKYEAAYQDRVKRGYAEHTRIYRRWPGGGEINFSDDELAYLSYDPLLRYEKDPKLRATYLDSLRFTWSQIRSDRNPLWNFISVACGGGAMTPDILEESRRTLERWPLDLRAWRAHNSHRLDVKVLREDDRHGRLQTEAVLPPDERPVHHWNSNPYYPDGGGDGRHELAGTVYLLPYWMGRYHGWIQ